ncbi:cation-translocating P-type ATPase [Tautonia sociabilis]|uniref:HAD family hydrolase n=1 Tax=Tautonia sociabilis TaxID=2080755 RepID=A0A432MGP4_9BACT|nr:HAD-IC family P-type ATPase [Tautonia sociabilis]RUL85716.1 HAD family hydrolase [Tautonia sociabilis]
METLTRGTAPETAEPWHVLPVADVLRRVDGREDGLAGEEARRRLERFGPNRLPEAPPTTIVQIAFRQFTNPLIFILAAAAVVSVLVGDVTDAAFIAAVLAINAVIGGVQEWRAERSSRALQRLLRIRASVLRDGELREVPAEEVVPGDVVWVESGNRVPADLRLLSAHGLEIDESFLTGESLAVQKDPASVCEPDTPMADRRNLAFAGSIVIRGRGRGVAVATGSGTAVGQLASDVLGVEAGKPPLLERMERFSTAVAYAVLASVVVVGTIGVLVQGHRLYEMFMFSVALAVSAIPEGLPAALTVALSVATTRMSRRGVIVRRLAAVEGLGSCSLIASDKTGTLTCNELTVREVRLPDGRVVTATGEGFVPEGKILIDGRPPGPEDLERLQNLALAAVLCNEGDLHQRDGEWSWRGDPTDLALLAFARKLGLGRERWLDRYPQENEIPFESEHRFSATYHRFDDGLRVFAKGAPERILAMCSVESDPEAAHSLRETALEMAERGYRVLALAEGIAPADLGPEQTPPEPSGLRLLGFVGMIDPLRPGVREAVDACHQAGIAVSMITGDHPVTALAIARELGFASSPDQVMTGRELEGLTDEQVREVVGRMRVFARVAPRQKLELVEAAREAGHFVAVTGDGVNDAPALRAANIGVAMGRSGTDVAREAAELVISDDNFATIVAGVEEGRVAYDNIRKVIYLLVSAGAAEVLVVGSAMAVGLELPLLAVQLLWLNLVTNGIQGVALAFEPSEGDVLRRPPRPPHEPIFNQLMIERVIVAALVMAVVGFSAYWWMIANGWSAPEARNALLLLMVLFENVHVGNCRSETKSGLWRSPFLSPILLWGVVAALLVHVLAMYYPPARELLEIAPVGPRTWLVLVGLSLTVFLAIELHKLSWWLRRRRS